MTASTRLPEGKWAGRVSMAASIAFLLLAPGCAFLKSLPPHDPPSCFPPEPEGCVQSHWWSMR